MLLENMPELHFEGTCAFLLKQFNLIKDGIIDIPTDYWQETEHRRKFFEDCASKLGFDAVTDPHSWQDIRKSKIIQMVSVWEGRPY